MIKTSFFKKSCFINRVISFCFVQYIKGENSREEILVVLSLINIYFMNYSETDILSYIKGELSAEEAQAFKQELDSSSELKEQVRQVRFVLSLSENLEQQRLIDTETGWKIISAKLKRDRLKVRLWHLLRVASVILLPLFLCYQYVLIPFIDSHKEQKMIAVVCAPGMTIKTILPDGSEVWLNSQSELRYPQKMNGKQRNVYLKGEAFFNVEADKTKRFNVITAKGITVSAYGTKFNVNAYSDTPFYDITLARGHVEITDQFHKVPTQLKPGEKATVDLLSQMIKVNNSDVYPDTAWIAGKLVFRKEKLENIALRLSHKFGVAIIIENEKLKTNEITATFRDENLDQILNLLKQSSSFEYKMEDRKPLSTNSYSPRVVRIK